MSVPDVPPTPPGSWVGTVLVLIGGLLLLPGVCALIFIPEYTSSPDPIPDSIMQAWIISFTISAIGIALIVYAFRR